MPNAEVLAAALDRAFNESVKRAVAARHVAMINCIEDSKINKSDEVQKAFDDLIATLNIPIHDSGRI